MSPLIYTGAITDLSGYAQAARDYVIALDSVGIDVRPDPKTFEPQNQYLVEQVVGRKLWSMIGKPREGKLQIIHLTPDNYKDFTHPERYKIGYYAWETSRLPPAWIQPINSITQEVWVPCEYLRQVSVNSGVQVPVKVLPHAIPLPSPTWKPQCTIDGLPEDRFKFYSIFQWSERKNPAGIIRSYYEAFSIDDPVIFVIKTYRVGDEIEEKNFIRREISRLKKETKGVRCPKILLIEDFIGTHEIQAIHHYCDCYVSMSRNEGFGIPAFQAASMGNSIVVPRYSAFVDHFTEQNSFLIDIQGEIPVTGMKHISVLYTGDMVWSDPSISHCAQRMREAFENQDLAKQKGLAAQKYISDNLSYTAIGNQMTKFLNEFTQRLGI